MDFKICDRNETFSTHLNKKFKGNRKFADNA